MNREELRKLVSSIAAFGGLAIIGFMMTVIA